MKVPQPQVQQQQQISIPLRVAKSKARHASPRAQPTSNALSMALDQNISPLLARNEKLECLVQRSESLSDQSKSFVKKAESTSSGGWFSFLGFGGSSSAPQPQAAPPSASVHSNSYACTPDSFSSLAVPESASYDTRRSVLGMLLCLVSCLSRPFSNSYK